MYLSILDSYYYCFFFSSRRRHTRWPRDWSSDVCSSDLSGRTGLEQFHATQPDLVILDLMLPEIDGLEVCRQIRKNSRSEERRVGKEGRFWWAAEEEKKKQQGEIQSKQ